MDTYTNGSSRLNTHSVSLMIIIMLGGVKDVCIGILGTVKPIFHQAERNPLVGLRISEV